MEAVHEAADKVCEHVDELRGEVENLRHAVHEIGTQLAALVEALRPLRHLQAALDPLVHLGKMTDYLERIARDVGR